MVGYFEVDNIPDACLDVQNKENDCKFKRQCNRYIELFTDNKVDYERWERLVCEGRPSGCPIKTRKEIVLSCIQKK